MTAIGTTPAAREPVDEVLDARSFAALADRHRAGLVAHCRRMVRCPERAEDAAQEALLRAWRARRSLAGRAAFGAWLRRIATNACLDEIRRASSPAGSAVPLRPEVEPPAPSAVVPDAVLDAEQALAQAVRRILGGVPPRQRAVLVLRGILDAPASETATILDMSVPAVNSALQRARATLRTGSSVAAGGGDASVLDRYIAALARNDVTWTVALARADAALPCAPHRAGRSPVGDASYRAGRCRAVRHTASG